MAPHTQVKIIKNEQFKKKRKKKEKAKQTNIKIRN